MKLVILILFYQIIITLNEIDLNELDLFNLIAFNLINGNIIVFSNKGFLTFDQDFKLLYNNSFPEEINRQNDYKTSNIYFPSYLKFPEEEGLVIILFLKIIYFFDYNGNLKKSNYLEEMSYLPNTSVSNYDITYYKKENSEYYYTIIVFNYQTSPVEMNLFYLKINLNGDNVLITNTTYYNTEEQLTPDFAITCQ